MALEHNPALIRAQEEVKKREAEFSLGVSEFLPQIRTSMGYTKYSDEYRYYGEPKTYTNYFSLSQKIFDPSTSFTTLGKKKLKDASKESMVAIRADVILSVDEAFFELARGEKFLEIAELILKRSEEEYKKTVTMVELGSASKLDLLRREVDISEPRLELAKAEKDRAIAEAR
ncbi:MAG: hypothetical protein COX49_02965, partial [bacterium (Candidatus Stahlbacteria) CG23_combo_of_CG06-09_8_20_14_all_40_9]